MARCGLCLNLGAARALPQTPYARIHALPRPGLGVKNSLRHYGNRAEGSLRTFPRHFSSPRD